MKSSFPAVVNTQTRVLILGSLPGDVSLARAQYYAHPQNQFWRLMSAVIGRDLAAEPYDVRLAALLAAGVGLWDVVASADRAGSLDGAIRDHRPNALGPLAATLPRLRAIGFNGAKASDLGRRALGGQGGLEFISLPSSSPAYTAPFASKLERWRSLKAFLGPAT